MQRIRVTYGKGEALRYTSNLDVHKVWERTLRRAHLPLAYSQGFHPQPRLNQACPLPLGLLSRCEMIDFWLEPDQSLDEVSSALNRAAPPGIDILKLEQVDLRLPALQTQTQTADYLVVLMEEHIPDDLPARIAVLLGAENLPRVRRDKTYDLRPLMLELETRAPDERGRPVLFMRLSARESATGRVDEVLAELGLDPFAARIERIALF